MDEVVEPETASVQAVLDQQMAALPDDAETLKAMAVRLTDEADKSTTVKKSQPNPISYRKQHALQRASVIGRVVEANAPNRNKHVLVDSSRSMEA